MVCDFAEGMANPVLECSPVCRSYGLTLACSHRMIDDKRSYRKSAGGEGELLFFFPIQGVSLVYPKARATFCQNLSIFKLRSK